MLRFVRLSNDARAKRADFALAQKSRLQIEHAQRIVVEVQEVAANRRGGGVSNRRQHTQLDKYDVAILSALATNNRLTTVEIASLVHLSRTAVSRRIAALKRMKVLSDSAYVLDYASIGFNVRAFIEVSAPSHIVKSLKKKLLLAPEVLTVAVIVGDGLLNLDVIAVDMEHLNDFVESIQGSGTTSTRIVLAEEESKVTLAERFRMLDEEATRHADPR